MSSETPKILGQAAPAITTETVLYTLPANTWAIFHVYACEENSAAAAYRVSISLAGAATSSKDYIRYDYPISQAGAHQIGPLCAQGGSVVRVYASTADMNFTASGTEIINT